MNLSILHFRPWLFAAAALLAVEATVYVVARPDPFDRTNFLQFSFAGTETPQRLFVFHKLKSFAYAKPTIVQSGDSSGLYGIDPREVMRFLPKGEKYVNMSCCANLGYRGYYNIFKFMGERNDTIRYFVLHITPYTMPRPELWDGDGAALWGNPNITVFGDAVHKDFLSIWRIFNLPSLALRRQVTDFVYYLKGWFE